MKKKTDHVALVDLRRGTFWSYDAIFNVSVSEHAKIVYLNLCRRADKGGQSFPSHSCIAKDCSISVRTVKRALNMLVETSIIKFDSGRYEGTNNTYSLLDIIQWNGGEGRSDRPTQVGQTDLPGRSDRPTKEYPLRNTHKKDNDNILHHQYIDSYVEQNEQQDDDGYRAVSLPKDSYFEADWLTKFLSRLRQQERTRAKRLAEKFDYLILTKGKPKWMKNETGSFVKLVAGEMNIRLPQNAPTFEERLEEERKTEQRRLEEEQRSEQEKLKAEEEQPRRREIEDEINEEISQLNEDELERFIQAARKQYELRFQTDQAVIESVAYRVLDGGGNWRERLKELLTQ